MVDALELVGDYVNVVWDPDYREARDVSVADEYFEFFAVKTTQCDVCNKAVTMDDSVVVYSLTVKQNRSFVDRFSREESGVWTQFLAKDWSVWLMCKDDAHKWGFLY